MIFSDPQTRFLLKELTASQVKLRYKRSVLGIAWSLLNPLLMMAVFTLIFSRFPKMFNTTSPYYLFFLTGYLPWAFFSQATQGGWDSIINNRALVKQASFDKRLLPAAVVAANLFHFGLALTLLVLFVLLHPAVSLSFTVVMLPAVMILQGAFIFGLIKALSVLNVIYRDVGQIAQVLITFLFYLTPVFYSLDIFGPDEKWISALLHLNPMAHFIFIYRAMLLEGHSHSLLSWLYVCACTIAAWRIGGSIFKKHSFTIAKEL